MKNLQPENFEIETTTVWSFPKRGNWATHHSKFRGNWAPQIPRNLILRYSKPKDLVLDQMCGSGTTCAVAKALGRKWIGIDLNPEYCEIARKRINAVTAPFSPVLHIRDAEKAIERV